MLRAFVGAGSNIEPLENLRKAMAALEKRFGALSMSSLYRTTSVGFEGEDFLNLVVSFETDLPVDEVVAALDEIEARAGRRREGSRFSSRTLDLDLLLYGDRVVDRAGLTLPRDDILEYAFVLGPLAELEPDLRHPTAGATMLELWNRFDRQDQPITRLGQGLS
ncbi:MAG: 2-amino-4-hydroxy-6-hydroxymethyldihydropteridine diphosphokinase [Gammaproteobacteria bacterium]|nr:2-amino-4-hydroxy-6-hydroxymethyldihydropteridine diphosphokinase [Gammaproteobacteria bacterium]